VAISLALSSQLSALSPVNSSVETRPALFNRSQLTADG
jgi:hypothetical protein